MLTRGFRGRLAIGGLTLFELVIVIAIIAMFGGLVAYRLTPTSIMFGGAGGGKNAARLSTESSMYQVQQAMFGGFGSAGYWDDMNHDMWFWPRYLEWLSRPPTDAVTVSDPLDAAYYNAIMAYDASKKVGWRGPYMAYQGVTIPLDATRGWTARLGGGAYKGPIDGWGNPIVVQLPSNYYVGGVNQGAIDPVSARGTTAQETYLYTNARLVSAGPDGILQTEQNIDSLQTYDDFQSHPSLVGDDVVYWLRR